MSKDLKRMSLENKSKFFLSKLGSEIREKIFNYSSLEDVVLKLRLLNRETSSLLKNSQIVRKNKEYTIREIIVQRWEKFDENLRKIVDSILPYTDTVMIKFSSE